MRAVDHAVRELAQTTVPGIEHLSAARSELRNLQALLEDAVVLQLDAAAAPAGRPAVHPSVQ